MELPKELNRTRVVESFFDYINTPYDTVYASNMEARINYLNNYDVSEEIFGESYQPAVDAKIQAINVAQVQLQKNIADYQAGAAEREAALQKVLKEKV